ncbi:MAG: hypothetical protein PQ612_07950 [Rickettsiales bacterium]|nr:hypothetical protein [Pseudomonadota bacterium]MDA0967020.1 hypothetical protein [Pseudomonadota bacterium]MDG4543940.1 hypothetical protein [Rickettsiales bacterium]MDG4546086.1 hypothetical protein [Rickettsiales bacterium]MDG4548332.1 hypothetical protein [Rickettsiales bacterium]
MKKENYSDKDCNSDNEVITYSSYEEMVNDLAARGINKDISNSATSHASVLLSAMFKNAKNHVNIYCEKLSDEVYDNADLIENAISFTTKRKGQINIILEQSVGNDFLDRPLIYKVGSALFRKKREGKSDEKKVGNLNVRTTSETSDHFTVMDNSAYREETDRLKRTAVANFGNHENAIKLHTRFNKMFENSNEALSI